MTKDNVRQLLVIVATVATIVMNGLATALPINGQTTGEISDRFEVFFVPAGYVFSIWGLIYAGLIAYTVFQALPAQRENPRLRSIGYLYVASGVANSIWIVLWHYEYFVLTLVMMGALLLSLIGIYLKLRESGTTAVFPLSSAEKWLVHIPFSIYLGWVSVATIANVTTALDSLNWTGGPLSPEVWTVIMLLIGVVLGGLMAFRQRDVAYGLVLVWAFVGIAVKQSDTAVVSSAAWVAAVAVVALLVASFFWHKNNSQTPPKQAMA